MADKTTTLTTQTGDSIYPNVLDENIPDTIARVSDVNNLKTNVETNYLTKADAETTYQQQAGMVDYVSKTYGDGTYATKTQLGGKQDKLTAGSNITINGTTIAAVRPENMALYGDLAATDEDFTGGTGGGGGATGGGGVSPTLSLLNFGDGDAPTLRTTITQAEKDNLEKGLYNQVLYFPSTDQRYDVYAPSKLWYDGADYSFAQFDIDTSSGISMKNASLYTIVLGAKDTDGNYPITVEKYAGVKVGGDSVSPRLNLMNDDLSAVRTSITEEEKNNIAKGLYHSVLYIDTSLGETASMSSRLSENAFHSNVNGMFGFSVYKVDSNNSITGARLYELRIGEQGSDGTYPITVSKITDLPFGGDNLLQKPSGLTKTELVGVGSNGQENIEIGDNLTLANGKLSATGSKSPTWLEYDETNGWNAGDIVEAIKSGGGLIMDGGDAGFRISNLMIGWPTQLPVFGYTLEGKDSLILFDVSEISPQLKVSPRVVDLQKKTYSHFITLSSNTLGNINFNYYDTRKEPHTIDTLKTALKGRTVSCSGYIDDGGTKKIATYIEGASNGSLSVGWFNISDGSTGRTTLDSTITLSDTVKPVEQVAMDNDDDTYDEGKAIDLYPRRQMVGGTNK